MQICVIDNGYYNTKLFQKEGHFTKKEKVFRSKVTKTDSLLPKNNCYIVEYQGRTYEVGGGRFKSSY